MPAPYVARALDIGRLAGRKSLFLFGPRQTGKTALISHALPGARIYDLLDGEVFLAFSARPTRLGEELRPEDRLVDQASKLPRGKQEKIIAILEPFIRRHAGSSGG